MVNISLNFVPEDPNDVKSSLVQQMAPCQIDDKPLPDAI